MAERARKLVVAVTGGSGQLGTVVLRRLADSRRVGKIISLDLAPARIASGKLETHRADVRDEGIGRFFEGCDAVVHLAFVVVKKLERAAFDAVNVAGSQNVIRAAATRGVPHVIYSSSIAAYGNVTGHPVPLREDARRIHQHDFAYASAKWRVEDWLDGFEREQRSLIVTRLRPSILVGAAMEHPLGTALRHRFLPGVGNAPLPLVWDEDVADAVALALDKGAAAHGAFNLCATDLLPARELARAAGIRSPRIPKALLAAGAKIGPALQRAGIGGETIDPEWANQGDVTLVPDPSKARDVLGWEPSCPTAVSVLRRFLDVVPDLVDPRIALFLRAVDLGARQAPPLRDLEQPMRVHLKLTGPGGGDWTLRTGDGHLHVESGAPRPPTSVVTLPALTMRDLIGGRADWTRTMLTGDVRIDGEQFAGFLVGGMFSMLRAQAESEGPRGAVARAMRRVLGRAEEGR